MIEKIMQFYNVLFHDNFSILAELGDLSKYKYVEMCQLLSKWKKKSHHHNQYLIVTWENKSNLITLKYDKKTGNLITILADEWKNFGLKFVRY